MVEQILIKLFGTSYRTSVRGFASMFVISIALIPQFFGEGDSRLFVFCSFAAAVLQGTGLVVAQDSLSPRRQKRARAKTPAARNT